MLLRALSTVLLFRSTLAGSHASCQCVINGVADNGLTYAAAILYGAAAWGGGLNNTCMNLWDDIGVAVDWSYDPVWITACNEDIGIDGDMIASACSTAQVNIAQATNGWSNCP